MSQGAVLYCHTYCGYTDACVLKSLHDTTWLLLQPQRWPLVACISTVRIWEREEARL